jgi:hypothetical protein
MAPVSRSSRSHRGRGLLVRVLGIAALVAVVVLVGGVFAFQRWLHNFVRGPEFHALVESQVGGLLQTEVKLEPLEWDQLNVRSSRLQAGEAPAFTRLQADEMRATVTLASWTRASWLVDGARIEKIVLDLKKNRPAGNDAAAPAPAPPPAAPAASSLPGWLQAKVDIPQIDVRSTNLRFGAGDLDFRVLNAAASLRPRNDGAFDLDLRGGQFLMAPFPGAGGTAKTFDLRDAQARVGHDAVYLTGSTMSDPGGAILQIEGTVPMAGSSRPLALHSRIEGLPVAEVVGPDWTNRIFGRLALDFDSRVEDGVVVHEGRAGLADARLITPEQAPRESAAGVLGALEQGWSAFTGTLLPVLGAYTDRGAQFRNLVFDSATCRFRKEPERIELRSIDLQSRGLLAASGELDIIGRDLQGLLQLGVARAALAGLPGAEAKVFTTERDGLLWTQVRISGTLDDPKEDLTARLVDAAGQRILEAVPQLAPELLQNAAGNAIKGAGQALDAGTRLLDETLPAIETGTRLLESIVPLPGLLRPQPAPPAPPTPSPEPAPPAEDPPAE